MFKRILPALACCAGLWSVPAWSAVDVNRADEAALVTVKGVGPAMARRIIEERNKQGAFKDATDLADRVKGLGQKSVARLQNEGLTIGAAAASASAKKGSPAAATPKAVAGIKPGKAADKPASAFH